MTTLSESPALVRRGYAMGLMTLGSVGLSFNALAIRSMEEADAWQIAFYRSFAFMGVAIGLLLFRYGRDAPARIVTAGRPALIGGALLAGASVSFLLSITYTTAAMTLFTLSAIPFITAALAWLILRESVSRTTMATMVAAALGVGLMVAQGIGSGSFYGNGMALVTALCFSGYAIVVRSNRGIEMLPALVASGFFVICAALVMRWGDLNIPLHDILLCFLIGAGLSGVGNILFIAASRHLVAAELTLFMLLEFALGPLWVWLFVQEVPAPLTIAGGLLVICAVAWRALIELQDNRRRKTDLPPRV